MNTINKVRFEFSMQNQSFAHELYGRWDNFFTRTFEKVAEFVLAKYDIEAEVISIEALELDLGIFYESNFENDFILVLEEKLEEALVQCLFHAQSETKIEIQKMSQTIYAFDILKHFLLQGILLDNSKEYSDIDKLVARIIRENPKEFKLFLRTYGHYTSLQERLVYQLNTESLCQGVGLLEPDSADFICSYVKHVQSKFHQMDRPSIVRSKYRDTIWLLVYAYLLTKRSSFFGKKSFVAQTVFQLAGKFNLSYPKLMEIITFDLQSYTDKIPIPIELFSILKELKTELDELQLKQSYNSAAKFYKYILNYFHQSIKVNTNSTEQEALITLLSKAESCRLFIQYLSEKQIEDLLYILRPQYATFVLQTVQVMEEQQTHGVLEGKAGGEFRLLKWQILFPLVLSEKNNLNRAYFVDKVFRSVASHYNCNIADLLAYTIADNFLQQYPELHRILKEMSVKYGITENLQATSKDDSNLMTQLSKAIRRELYLSAEEIASIWKQFGKEDFQREFIHALPESDRLVLFELICPRDANMIQHFILSLSFVHTKGGLEGKAGGEFQYIKWQFVFATLNRIPANNFHAKTFVEQVLNQLAAHYNMAYFEVLNYFHTENINLHLTYSIHNIIRCLYAEERNKWVKMIHASTTDEQKHRLIANLYPTSSTFIREYKNSLNISYHQNSDLQTISFTDYDRLCWRFIFAVLLDMQNKVFSTNQFVFHTLTKLAKQYRISLINLLEYFHSKKPLPPNNTFREINRLIEELYTKYKLLEDKNCNAKEAPRKIEGSLKGINSFFNEFGNLSKKDQTLLYGLLENTDFVRYTKDILKLMPHLQVYFSKELRIFINHSNLLFFLTEIASTYQSLSKGQILQRLLAWFSEHLNNEQLILFNSKLKKRGLTNPILANSFPIIESPIPKNVENKLGIQQLNEALFVHNGGAVLLSPYLPQLFRKLLLINNNGFVDSDAQIKALNLIQYAVFGYCDFPEYELLLNKLLTAYKTGKPLMRNIELTKEETDTVDSLLQGVIQNWSILKNTSIEGLRESFLQRTAKLINTEDAYILTMEEKSYDMLLDSLPWNFRSIKYSWMEKSILVKWR